MAQLSFHSPIGDLTISEEDGLLVSLDWGWSPFSTETPFLRSIKNQMDQYFDGKKPDLTPPIKLRGTAFQTAVWQEMLKIPYGETRTYGEIAATIGSHPRPVGAACGLNPIPIIIPCHRIMGKDGKLTGYSGGNGVETKEFLIELERTTFTPQ
ncbi:Methylated-DNA--protein-cysteine methyltransferase [hydrothermal vent metagenome]|uniref:methylated-DNA--[protein]-cysteine S-methyltransferase n=1 Tax=hydrothermal vent metagenome TaxID=652676 RepID=A0A3B1BVH7_9ZZZZ